MADNTLQFEWIVTIEGGLDLLFKDDPNVFVAGDLLWYSVEGKTARLAPDAMVVFGRPKGYRGSYRQWEEGGIAPQVVFEVLSPSNKPSEMASKRHWYARYGAEEYYEYDPDRGKLRGWLLRNMTPIEIPQMQGWVSPRLGVTFGLEGMDLVLVGPDGKRFQSYRDVGTERNTAIEERDEIAARQLETASERDRERERAERLVVERDQEQKRAEQLAAERDQVAAERDQEQKRAERLAVEREQERDREWERAQQLAAERDQERERAERLAAKLRELGIEP